MMKRLFKILFVVVLCLVLTQFCFSIYADNKNKSTFENAINNSISVNNFILYLDSDNNSEFLTKDQAIEYSKIKLNDEELKYKDRKNIEVDTEQLQMINDVKESGVYELTFKYEKSVEIVKVFVLDENDIVQENIIFFANNFTLNTKEASILTDEFIISLADVSAYDVNTGEKMKVSTDYSEIKSEFGSYNVTFTTKNNRSVVVRATVGDNLIVVDNTAIAASDITIDKDFLNNYKHDIHALDSILLDSSDARVWNIENNKDLHSVHVSRNHQSLNSDLVINENIDESIYAKDFAISAQEVSKLTDDEVIELAKASARRYLEDIEIEIKNVDFSEVKTRQGKYNVTFETEKGTKITKRAFVGKNNPPTIDEKRRVVIFANDYEVKKEEALNITNDKHIKLSNVEIFDLDSSEKIDVEYIDVLHDQKEGKYSAKFGTEKEHYATVELRIVSESRRYSIFLDNWETLVLFVIFCVLIMQFKRVVKR